MLWSVQCKTNKNIYWFDSHTIKFTVWRHAIHFSKKSIFTEFVQSSSLSNFRIFPSLQKEAPCPLAVTVHSFLPPVSGSHNVLYNIFMDLPILDMPHKWKHAVCRLCLSGFFSQCFQGSSALQLVSALPSFLGLSGILLYHVPHFVDLFIG